MIRNWDRKCVHGSGPFCAPDWNCRLGRHVWLPYPYHPCCDFCGKKRYDYSVVTGPDGRMSYRPVPPGEGLK